MTGIVQQNNSCSLPARAALPVCGPGVPAGLATSKNRERGSVLVIVLWIAFGLVALALYFAQSAYTEYRAADNYVAGIEAEQAIEGALRYLTNLLATVQTNSASLPDLLSYQQAAVQVGNAMFWVIGRNTNIIQTGPDYLSFGLVDESSKLNLNTATAAMLECLPRMTPDLAANIVTWRDASQTNLEVGVPPEIYLHFIPPYRCKQAPFETVEELRLVYGMTNSVLYGEDMNMNGVLEFNENDGDANAPPDNADGRLDPGLFEYLTIWSREPNIALDGTQRIDVTSTNAQTELATLLQQRFGTTRANEILLNVGLGSAQPGQQGGGRGQGGQQGQPGGQPAQQPTPTPSFGSPLEFYLISGMTEDEFAQVADYIATTNSSYMPGLVNVNTASEAVLACLPGIGSNMAPALVSYRISNPANLRSVAWVANVLDRQSAIQAGPYITSRSYQYTADIAAVGHYGRGFRRVKFVIDMCDGTPKVLYRQDLTRLGWPLGRQIRKALQLTSGTDPAAAARILGTVR
ncbi:MAG TPA: helix-hairpin-helix domain-containing protein [Verrucomicrobiota bacterium]|nr:helix-hairpin-helix domain-containing protein [Verrucomicrobiota bacterium]